MSLPTVTDLKLHLDMSSTKDDDELVDVLDAAVEMVGGLIGPITPITVTEKHRNVSSGSLLLRRTPVLGLVSVSVSPYFGAASTLQPISDYELDAASGTAWLANGYRHYGDIAVTYTVGRDDLPASIRLAILIVAAHLWETQRGTAPTALALQQQDTFSDSGTFGAGFAIPNRAKELLAPYVRPTVA